MSKRPKAPSGSQSTPKKQKTKTWTKPKTVQEKLAKPELKVFDTANAFNFDSTGEVPATGQLCLIQTGDTLNDRDGATVQLKSVQIRGVVTFTPGANATAASVMYLYLVHDRQCNGAAAAITDVLTGTNMASAMGNVPNQYRFKILKRIVVPCIAQAGVTTAYNNVVVPVEEYIKFFTPIEVRYKASTGAITDITSNNLFFLAGSDGNSDDTGSFVGTTRLRFTG